MKAMTTILILVTVIIGLFLWMFIGNDDDALLEASGAGVTRESAPAGPAARRHDGGDEKEKSSSAKSEEPTAALERAVASPIEGGILVLCVRKDGGAALPGAKVFVKPIASARTRALRPGSPVEVQFREAGDEYLSDGEGRVWIPPTCDWRFLLAVCGDLVSEPTQVPAGETEPLRVELAPRREIKVAVEDGAGRPRLDIPVALRAHVPGSANWMDVEVVRTDARGLAAVSLAGLRDRGPQPGTTYVVAIVGAFAEACEVPVDVQEPPTETLKLRLPACGRIVVRANPKDPDADARMYLTLAGELKTRATETFDGPLATFVAVGLGLDLRLDYIPGNSSTDSRQEILLLGPSEEGETIELALDRAAVPERPLLTAELVDGNGRLLADRMVILHGFAADATVASVHVESSAFTDAFGRVRIGLSERAATIMAQGRFAMIAHEAPGRALVQEFAARVFPPGLTDLGRLTMEGLPSIVNGRVVDEQAAALSGVSIRLELPADRRSPGRVPSYGGLHTVTDREGRFSICDRSVERAFDLVASKAGFEDQIVQVKTGSEDIVVTLHRESRVKLRCRTESGGPITGIYLERSAAGSKFGWQRSSVPIDGLVDEAIEAGSYDLAVVRAAGFIDEPTEVLAEWKSLVMAPGESKDLGEVAIAQRGIDVEVTIDLAAGFAPESFEYRVFERDGKMPIAQGYLIARESRTLRFNVDHLPIDLEVMADRGEPVRKLIVEQKDRIDVGPGRTLQVTLKISDAALANRVAVIHIVGPRGFGSPIMTPLGRIDPLPMALPAVGKQRVMVMIDQAQIPSKTAGGEDLFSPSQFTVATDDPKPGVTLTFHAALLRYLDEAEK